MPAVLTAPILLARPALARLARGAFLLAALLLVSGAPSRAANAPPPLAGAPDTAPLTRALKAADDKDWGLAYAAARESPEPLFTALVDWMRLQSGDSNWPEYRAFLNARPSWPSGARIRRLAERSIPRNESRAALLDFFATRPPLTARGRRLYGEALIGAGRKAQGEAVIRRGWLENAMPEAEQNLYERKHAALINGLRRQRLDAMLWRGRAEQARRLYGGVGPGWRALSEARIALRARDKGVDGKIAALPKSLRGDPGLAYERMRWRLGKGRRADAAALFAKLSRGDLGRPQIWAAQRMRFARAALERGEPKRAYALATRHGLSKGGDFAELEWFAGWVALRKLDDPERAAKHFQTLWNGVSYPISRARAAYWLGRTLETRGRKGEAADWYARAADFGATFYGQLAAERIGRAPDPALSRPPAAVDWSAAKFLNGDPARAAIALQRAGRPDLALRFVAALAAKLDTKIDFAALAQLGLAMNAPHFAVSTAKIAARKGFSLPPYAYPTPPLPRSVGDPELALSLALARQESELNPRAISPAGARGLMQLMPRTAKVVAAELGTPYEKARLIDDPRYNARLGQKYLADRIEEFGGSYILAIASYNAGPRNVRLWIEEFGDPRARAVDPIDWIETIPFAETRNYVQRVLESVQVYRARLDGPQPAWRLMEDLSR